MRHTDLIGPVGEVRCAHRAPRTRCPPHTADLHRATTRTRSGDTALPEHRPAGVSDPGAMTSAPLEHLDVIIVGAGLSGIGAAVHLQQQLPGRTYAVLESRDAVGGTWDLFRYPGVRSDSDMYTLGYAFRPWPGATAIADGPAIRRSGDPAILDYVRDNARDHYVDDEVRFRSRVVHAEWSSPDARWTVTVEDPTTGARSALTCSFLFMCSGYYRYDEGYTPAFEGIERFGGQIVHPQHWPEDLDHAGKRVVVIGSGATAVTLVPALAGAAASVTMLQRSPTYIASRPAGDRVANLLRDRLPATTAYSLVRWKNVLLTMLSYQLSRRRPELMKALVRKGLARELPGFDVEQHFTPPYDPWDQRFCIVPNGDLFRALREGSAAVVTGHIETFTETGIRLTGGQELEADLVITATGLTMLVLGGTRFVVDGREVPLSQTVGYKGTMFSGLPDLAAAIGYTNASWTLKCDLICAWVCRLLGDMGAVGVDTVVPEWTEPELSRSRSSICSPATCCAPSATSPSRAPRRRGGSTRTTCSTGGCSGTVPVRTTGSGSPRAARRRPSQADARCVRVRPGKTPPTRRVSALTLVSGRGARSDADGAPQRRRPAVPGTAAGRRRHGARPWCTSCRPASRRRGSWPGSGSTVRAPLTAG